MIYVLKEDYDKVKDSLGDKKCTVVKVDKVINVNGIPIKLYQVDTDKSRKMNLDETLGGEVNERVTD